MAKSKKRSRIAGKKTKTKSKNWSSIPRKKAKSIEHFRVTGKITKLLGRESVSNEVTALQEILKNSHDADALSVDVNFQDFEKGMGKIIIKEEKGDGMTYDEIKNNFLVIGTYAKQPDKAVVIKTKRLKRAMIGRKGVGRFALEKLGKQVKIVSKPFGTLDKFTFSIDWEKFEPPEVTVDQVSINVEQGKRTDKKDSGLEIEILQLRDKWDNETIHDFIESMKSLILPKKLQPNNPFNIFVTAELFDVPRTMLEVKLEEKSFYRLEAELKRGKIILNAKKLGKKYLPEKILKTYESFTGKNQIKNTSELTCGSAKLIVYYFPVWSKGDPLRSEYYDKAQKHYGEKLHADIPKLFKEYHGVRIHREGLREFRYGDPGYDWVARDKISRGLSGTVQVDRLIGYCMITGEKNPEIIATTNRTEAINNQAFRDLQDFVIASMRELDRKISYDRRKKLQDYKSRIKPTLQNLKKLSAAFTNTKVKKAIEQLEKELDEELNIIPIVTEATKVVEKQEQEHDEIMTSDEITLANASVGDYLGRLYHDYVDPVVSLVNSDMAKLISLGKRKDGDYEELSEISQNLSKYWSMLRVVFDAIEGLNSGLGIEDYYKRQESKIELKNKVQEISQSLKLLFEFDDFNLDNQINPKLEIKIFGPVIYSILYNLLSNSIKSLKNQKKKNSSGNFISIRSRFEKNFIIFFSDNSTDGIPSDRWETVFYERISSTSKSNILPGHGIGLYILKRMLIYVKGTIQIIKPLYGQGTTFKIELPLEYVSRE